MASFADDQHGPNRAHISALQRVILELHGCSAKHLETVWVHEMFFGKSIWSGDVEVFEVDHPRSRRCYAWLQAVPQGNNYVRLFAVLGSSAIKNSLDAVKYVHVAESAPLINEFSKLAGRQDKPS
jgi:hypothetical protein